MKKIDENMLNKYEETSCTTNQMHMRMHTENRMPLMNALAKRMFVANACKKQMHLNQWFNSQLYKKRRNETRRKHEGRTGESKENTKQKNIQRQSAKAGEPNDKTMFNRECPASDPA